MTRITRVPLVSLVGAANGLAGTGADGRVSTPLRDFVSVMDAGAIGDGEADDAAAINALLADCDPGQVVRFPACAGYLITAPIVVPRGVSVWMESPVIYGGSADEPAVVVGEEGNGNLSTGLLLRINVRRLSQSDWESEESVGVRLINCQYCTGEIVAAEGFTVGVHALGSSSGFAYNKLGLGRIRNNKIAVLCESKGNTGGAGFVNENSWIGGNFTVDSTVHMSKSRYGSVIRSADGEYVNNNNNVFYRPAYQLKRGLSGGAKSYGFVVEDGTNNYVELPRFEEVDVCARFDNGATRNVVRVGYYSDVGQLSEDASEYPLNLVVESNDPMLPRLILPVLQYPSVALSCSGESGVDVSVSGMSWVASSEGSTLTGSSGPGPEYDGDQLTIPESRAVGFTVDTSAVKLLAIYRSAGDGQGGRVVIKCFDANKQILSGGGDVKSAITNTGIAEYTPNYGGAYRQGADSEAPLVVRLSDQTKFAWIGISGGTSPAKLKSLSVFCEIGLAPPSCRPQP